MASLATARFLASLTLALPWGAEQDGVGDWIERLGDQSIERREDAVKALVALGEAARTPLERAAGSHDDPDVRANARAALRRLDELLEAKRRPQPPPFEAGSLRARVEKRGRIAADETWGAQRTVVIREPLVIAATVTIEPGAVVLIAGGCDLRVEGRLIALSGERPIVLTSLAEADGGPAAPWGKLSGDGILSFRNVQLRHGGGVTITHHNTEWQSVGVFHTSGDGVTIAQGYALIRDLVIREAGGTGLVFQNGHPTLSSVVVSGCATGVACRNSAFPTLSDLQVTDCATGLEIAGSSYPTITELSISRIKGDAISVQGTAYPSIHGGRIEKAATAVALKERGRPERLAGITARGCGRVLEIADGADGRNVDPPKEEK